MTTFSLLEGGGKRGRERRENDETHELGILASTERFYFYIREKKNFRSRGKKRDGGMLPMDVPIRSSYYLTTSRRGRGGKMRKKREEKKVPNH